MPVSDNTISFKDINNIAYVAETEISNTLLNFIEPEYKKRIHNIEDRASEIVNTVRKSIKSDSPIENLLQEYELKKYPEGIKAPTTMRETRGMKVERARLQYELENSQELTEEQRANNRTRIREIDEGLNRPS